MRGLLLSGLGALLVVACGSGPKVGEQGGTTGGLGASSGTGAHGSGTATGGSSGTATGIASGNGGGTVGPVDLGDGGCGWTTLGACTNTSTCMSASDCAAPTTPCLVASCEGECCGTAPAPAGTSCGADGGASVCDGSGACVTACSTPADCPAPAVCYEATCTNGVCGSSVTLHAACSAVVPECCSGRCVDAQSDVMNCGSCNNVCEATCSGGACQPQALQVMCGVAVDASYVYWGEYDPDKARTTIWRSSKSCGERTALATVHAIGFNLAIDATHVYWTNQAISNVPGSVMKVPIAGGAVTTIATAETTPKPAAIAVTGQEVYWVDDELGVMSAPTSGGAPAIFSEVPVTDSALGLATNETTVYWSTSNPSGMLLRSALTGGKPTEIASVMPSRAVALDATNVYWSNPISKLPLAGGAATVLWTDAASSLAADDANVYWVSTTGLYKVSVNGGTVATLSSVGVNDQTQGLPLCTNALALDDTSVYWVGLSGSQYGLYKAAK